MVLVFTLCSNNYLAQAITLGNTLIQFNENYTYKIGLVDRKSNNLGYSKIPYEIIEVEKIGIECFNEMTLRYNIWELNTAVKPYYFQYLFKNFNPDSIIFLDPDIQVFSPFNKLEMELKTNDIVVTPHFMTPINDDKWQSEEDFLNSGIYNLGFIAINNSSIGHEMIDWWAKRLKNRAYIDFCRGLFTDQIWINFVPLFFEKVKILRDKGYNVAYWNLHERILSVKDGEYIINNECPLVFYHYASFRPNNPGIISSGQKRYTFDDRPDIAPLFSNYCELVFNNNYDEFVKQKCFFTENKERLEREQLESEIKNVPFY